MVTPATTKAHESENHRLIHQVDDPRIEAAATMKKPRIRNEAAIDHVDPTAIEAEIETMTGNIGAVENGRSPLN